MRKDSQPQRRPKGLRKGKGRASPAAEPRANLYDELTARIIAELDAGTFPWVRPWGRAGAGRPGLPRNGATGRRYSGVNVLLLWGAGFSEGYVSQNWLTFRQALAAGGNVRKGERGTTVVYADRFTPEAEKERARETGEDARVVPFLKRFTVFNLDQCEGLDRLAPERVSDIALQPGEELIAVSAGDTVRWVIGDTVSGAGDHRRVHVLVKPFAAGLRTNMVITTTRRAYHLALESTDATAMAAISWTYPQDRLLALQRRNDAAAAAQTVAPAVAVENLRFRYAITGDAPPWRPLRAWDDGAKVYIEFPARLDQGEAPPLFVVGPLGDAQLVNYRVSGHHYIVDRLFAAAELRMGEAPQQVVRITRTDGDQRRGRRAWR
ncbi:P-type conjugative transfer protein TrbG [Brevundimonas diminuta]|uniref:P-type conjugative transfer protein TrbG n=1 Tax=Brevundimonas diminuta TaxID=293 RepID=UPI000A76BD68|nr:P-type conjugative transfer protein TrbG [Brevundimonas diminuta]